MFQTPSYRPRGHGGTNSDSRGKNDHDLDNDGKRHYANKADDNINIANANNEQIGSNTRPPQAKKSNDSDNHNASTQHKNSSSNNSNNNVDIQANTPLVLEAKLPRLLVRLVEEGRHQDEENLAHRGR